MLPFSSAIDLTASDPLQWFPKQARNGGQYPLRYNNGQIRKVNFSKLKRTGQVEGSCPTFLS